MTPFAPEQRSSGPAADRLSSRRERLLAARAALGNTARGQRPPAARENACGAFNWARALFGVRGRVKARSCGLCDAFKTLQPL